MRLKHVSIILALEEHFIKLDSIQHNKQEKMQLILKLMKWFLNKNQSLKPYLRSP